MAGIHPRDSGVQERLQDLLVAKGPKDASAEQRGIEGYEPPDALCLAGRGNGSPGYSPRLLRRPGCDRPTPARCSSQHASFPSRL